jgi:L-lactate permease
MTDKEKNKDVAFNSNNPLSQRKDKTRKRKSPFYRPEPIKRTPEEIARRKAIKKKQQLAMKIRIKSGNYDPFTEMIATLLTLWTVKLTNLYLWRYQLWNAALIEGTGLTIYYVILTVFGSSMPLILALGVCSAVSFFVKFMMYKLWMFKDVIKSGKKKKSSDSNNSTLKG